MGLNFTIGDTFRVLGKKASYFFALTYDNAWQNRHTRLQFTKLVDRTLEITHAYDVERLENEITLSGIFVTGIDLTEGHRLRLTSLVNRITSNMPGVKHLPYIHTGRCVEPLVHICGFAFWPPRAGHRLGWQD